MKVYTKDRIYSSNKDSWIAAKLFCFLGLVRVFYFSPVNFHFIELELYISCFWLTLFQIISWRCNGNNTTSEQSYRGLNLNEAWIFLEIQGACYPGLQEGLSQSWSKQIKLIVNNKIAIRSHMRMKTTETHDTHTVLMREDWQVSMPMNKIRRKSLTLTRKTSNR